MSRKPSDNLQKYLLLGGGLAASCFLVRYFASRRSGSGFSKALYLLGGGLAASYFLVHYLALRRSGSSKALSLETTLKLLREIKYFVYFACIVFADGVNAKLKANYPAKDLEVSLRTELANIYESRQETILKKHMVSRD